MKTLASTNFRLSSDDVKFISIPHVFLFHYRRDLELWAKNFRRIGPLFKVWLRRDVSGVPLILGDGSDYRPMVPIIRSVVTLKAIPTRAFQKDFLIIVPVDHKAAKEIVRHSQELEELYAAPENWESLQ